jgi:hypothetical protein
MLKRTLVIAAAVIAAQSGVAFADNNWAFDDNYWKNPARSGSATMYKAGSDTTASTQFGKYIQVDGYNY